MRINNTGEALEKLARVFADPLLHVFFGYDTINRIQLSNRYFYLVIRPY